MKMYIAVLDEFPDYMTPTLVAHSILAAHQQFAEIPSYQKWLNESFRKCVVRVNAKEFEKISSLPNVHLGHENKTLNAKKACAVVCPIEGEQPKVLQFAKLWKPQYDIVSVDFKNNKTYQIDCDYCLGKGTVDVEEHWGGPYPIYRKAPCFNCKSGKKIVPGDELLNKISRLSQQISNNLKLIETLKTTAIQIGDHYG